MQGSGVYKEGFIFTLDGINKDKIELILPEGFKRTPIYNEKISIIVPVYNVERYIRKCVKSLINQTYKNIEIILVNDGSPDNCGQICDDFAREDRRIVVIHKENGGLCSARNAGLSVATGKYIGFVDSDDWIRADMYEYLYINAKSHDADIACCNYYRVTAKSKWLGSKKTSKKFF